MFENLPKIAREDIQFMVDEGLPRLIDRIDGDMTLAEDVERLTKDLKNRIPAYQMPFGEMKRSCNYLLIAPNSTTCYHRKREQDDRK